MQTIRLLNLDQVSALHSQTIYHAVAHAMNETTPDTIILVAPDTPYVCIGYHQELEKEVDLGYCQEHGLPVYRREVGGGAVYLDHNQVFLQWIFQRGHVPAALDQQFVMYIQPLVETYQQLGIQAYHRPINDVQVAGRKIGGTGAMATGEAVVLVGSLMFDFDMATMAQVLKVPSEKMRDKIHQSLQEYMTTMRRELGTMPDRAEVVHLYLRCCTQSLDAEIAPGTLTDTELALVEEIDARFNSAEWLYQKGGLRQSGIKIHEDVRVVEAAHKVAGGLIRVTCRLREGRVDDLTFSGDFTMLPAIAMGALEQALRGLHIQRELLTAAIQNVYQVLGVQSPGVVPADFVEAILLAAPPG